MISEKMREVIQKSELPLSEISKLSGLTYSRVHDFVSGKRDFNGKSLSKVFRILPRESQELFSRLILE